MAAEEVGVALNLPPTTDGMTMARLKTESQATATQGVAEAATPRTVIEATAVVSRSHLNFTITAVNCAHKLDQLYFFARAVWFSLFIKIVCQFSPYRVVHLKCARVAATGGTTTTSPVAMGAATREPLTMAGTIAVKNREATAEDIVAEQVVLLMAEIAVR